MIVLSASKLNKAFVEDIVFEDVSFHIEDHDKIGFVGVNGAGKTTLFKSLLHPSYADSGEVFTNKETVIGYMQQHADITSDKTVWEELMTVYADMLGLEKELDAIARQIEDGTGDLNALIERQAALLERFERRGGYLYKNIAKSSLIGLGFAEDDLNKPFETLSGGQKTRVLLCKILLSDANLLLLDEPTNHLDISSVEWLENFLRDYNGAFVIISHDRYFLDRVTNKTLELENRKLTVYNGNYTRYLALKEEARLAKQRQYENTKREIDRIEGIIEQQKRWNQERNYKTIASKQKEIDRLEKTLDAPESEPAGLRFRFHINAVGGNDVLRCSSLAMAYGIKKIFSGVELDIKKKEHVFLLGENGCGKTTLFKLLTGDLHPIDGEIHFGAGVQVGYYDQAQENLHEEKTVLDEVYDAYPGMSLTEVRNALGAFLFHDDDVFKPISALSGGERAKVSLLKLMLSGANLLLLDEPTNHLDISSREALEDALLHYEGTLFIVSHDRYFINKIADRILYMQNHGLTNYAGNYDYFLEKFKGVETEKTAAKPSNKETYQEQKRREAEKRKTANRFKRVEEQIEQLEEEVRQQEALLLSDEYATDHIKASELLEQVQKRKDELEQLYAEWETLGELVEE
ncbi:MAG TPA: ABC-F type ribosomal protection protein [Candidatus Aphodoplasma excrementigallinarum]|uniref:ABC-F type ribosomal protection protein n=1 Tax=Candidatus Aphodoplasma excrementigallinarum TaxID=2840673 RepID=A0A9D1NHI0_9FIRM|nr:ABC-F type ribosomal protection protein [Candidatus Aphodoplasma excrementigallinarum]